MRVLQPSLDDTASDGSGKLTILLAELDAFLADNKARTAQLARGSTYVRCFARSVRFVHSLGAAAAMHEV